MITPEASLDDGARRRAIRDELARIEERTKWSAQGQLEQAKTWRAINIWLGAPTAAASAIAGALVLASQELNIFGGVLALVAAASGAVLTTVNASSRANRASAAGNAYLEIQSTARQVREVDLPWATDLDETRQILSELSARVDEQNKTAEPISRSAYRKARKNIEGGGQTYAVDEARAEESGNGAAIA